MCINGGSIGISVLIVEPFIWSLYLPSKTVMLYIVQHVVYRVSESYSYLSCVFRLCVCYIQCILYISTICNARSLYIYSTLHQRVRVARRIFDVYFNDPYFI